MIDPDNVKPTIYEPLDKNKYFGEDVANRVPMFLVVLSIVYFSVGAIGTMLLYVPKEPKKGKKIGSNKSVIENSKGELVSQMSAFSAEVRLD